MFNHRCFREPRKGYVAHTAASKRLATDENARAGLGYMFEECWPGMARVSSNFFFLYFLSSLLIDGYQTVDAMEKFGGDEVNQTVSTISRK